MALASTFAGKIRLDLIFNEIVSGVPGGSGGVPKKLQVALDLANGTTDGKIDKVYAVSESAIAASTTTSYDLSGTSLKDLSGNNTIFAEVCLIAIRNKRTTTLAYLIVGPHATNGFGKLVSSKGFWGATADVTNGAGSIVAPAGAVVPDGGWVVMYAPEGVPVTAATADILAVVTSGVAGSTNAYDLIVAGRSA